MRVTNQMMLNNMRLYLNKNMTALTSSQDMLASGHRISKPSDDPIGTINTMRFSTNILETEEYLEKIDQSTNFMDTTDSTLNNVNSVMQRVRELVVYAANGTHNDESRKAIADEIEQLREHLELVANTTYGSKNIFAGTNVTTAPYDANNDVWLGNSGKVELEIGNGVTIQINSVMQEFFYNTGSTISGQAVDLSRLTQRSQLEGKTFNLVFNELEKNSRFITITDDDIGDAGWGHPSEQDFVNIVKSSLATTSPLSTFSYDAVGDQFLLNAAPAYMQIGAITINNAADLTKLQNHTDITGSLEFHDDAAWTIDSTPASTVVDEADIARAAGWSSVITSSQFNTIAKDMAKNATVSGYSLEYDRTAGTYTLDGVAGSLQVAGVEVTGEYLDTVDDHSALLGKVLTFVPTDAAKAPSSLGTFDAAKIAVSDWGINPTGEQYKDILQIAIDRSIGVMLDGKPKVKVSGDQDTGYTLQVMDTSLLPADGNPAQVKLRTLGKESLGTVGNAAANIALSKADLDATVTSYFDGLVPAGKYMVAYDGTLGVEKYTISLDGGVTTKTGKLIMIDEAGGRTAIDPLIPPTLASEILGKKIVFEEDGLGGNTWPTSSYGQPYLIATDLDPALLTMDNLGLVANLTAALKNLNTNHTLEVDNIAAPTQITGMDGVPGTIKIDGIAVTDISTYLTDNGDDFSKLVGKKIEFVPDEATVTSNQVNYINKKTGVQTRESLALFTLGGQGLNGRGVRYQDDDIGLFQLMDRIVIDVRSGDHDNIDSNLGVLDERMNTLNAERSLIGARVNRLELQKDRMTTSKENYTALLARYQDADMAQVIMDLNMQENVYRASLSVGARIIQPSLIDFLN